MPYDVRKDDRCPVSKPWALIKKDGDVLLGCHETEAEAVDQMQAVGANSHRSVDIDPTAFRRLTMTREYYDRSYPLDGIEILSRAKGGDGRTVTAYAAIFDTPQEIHDAHGDYIERNDRRAFNMTINSGAAKRALPLYNHGLNVVDGKPEAMYGVPLGSPLEIKADGRGLLTVTRYNKSPLADSILEAIKNDDIRAQSYRGTIFRSSPAKPRGGYRANPDGTLPEVTRLELGLSDYGPTPRPYYEGAAILAVRSATQVLSDIAGLSETERAELIRMLATTPLGEPEPATATATPAAGTEEPRNTHSGRMELLRLRAEALFAGVGSAQAVGDHR